MSSSAAPAADHSVGDAYGTTLVAALLFVTLVVTTIGSLGAPLITAVAQDYDVSLTAAQWTLTITLLSGAVATPLLGRLGSARRRRTVALTTLAAVTAGSVATVVPAPFAVLLIGRAAQGVVLGLPALMMATARQHLGARAPSTIAMLSIASTVGIGFGYPIAGLLAQFGGLRGAYLLGVVITAAALVTAFVALPRDSTDAPGEESVDWFGASLLSLGLVAVLLVTSEYHLWSSRPVVAGLIMATGLVLLAGFVTVERRIARPLVDLAALRHPAVAGANLVMAVSGVAMYLLFVMITRYMQTPSGAGYGYGLTELESGLVLVPFSALGFVGGRVVRRLRQRLGPFALLAVSGAVLTVACAVFATTKAYGVVWPIVTMGVLGVGVGVLSSSMPQAILSVTPTDETAAAISVNHVVRTVGFSIGSALGGLLLAAYTAPGHLAPDQPGYTTGAWAAAALAVVSIVVAVVTHSVRRRHTGADVADGPAVAGGTTAAAG